MPIFYVYILKCVNRITGNVSLYTGSTQNLIVRFEQHQKGKGARYTRGKDIELVYFETFLTRSEAMKKEYAIKQLSKEQKWDLVNNFQSRVNSKKKNETKKL
ncbi:MAG: GIY-YIG nuclease family protein [Candidatus Lokiarchaeota archaeon]|nr:GIY-YIG nuclease family protein [Candidatus Harpocratesius repetitus]